MTIFSALLINVLLILDIDEINGALFLNIKSLWALSFSLAAAAAAKRFITSLAQYMIHYNHTNLTSIYFLVANFILVESLINLDALWCFFLY